MVSGIDVSHYNGVIDWPKVAESGVKFVYIKCTDGPTWTDPKWFGNREAAQACGLKVGSYHFLRPSVTADQLNQFIQLMLSGRPQDLPPCLDVELPGELPVLACAQRIADELKRVPVIYTNPSIAKQLPFAVTSFPLWIAEYAVHSPGSTAPWLISSFWQHTNNGAVLGIQGNVDLDWFNGDEAQFEKFLEDSKVLPT